jgi:hypothetical protein
MTFAYFVANSAVNGLIKKATDLKIPTVAVDFQKNINNSRPFDAVAIPSEIESKIGGGRVLRDKMQKSLEVLKEHNEDDEDVNLGYEISALQMSTGIPLDYMRFLTKENKEREFYIGGTPDNAGQLGNLYVLASKEESTLFLKTLREFGPLPNFSDDLFVLSNIDSGFKSAEPRKVKVDNCLILESKEKFEINQKLKLPGEESIDEGKGKKEEEELTVLDALNLEARKIANLNTLTPGKFVKGTQVQGTLVAHFNRDFKKVILWCGHQPINLTGEKEKELREIFNLSHVDKTFTK